MTEEHDAVADGHGPDSDADDARPRRSVGRNVMALLASQSITWVFATVVAWMVPRYLGDERLGEWRVAASVAAIVVVLAECGTDNLLTVEIARDRSSVRSLFGRVMRLRAIAYALVVPLVILFLVVGSYDAPTTHIVLLMTGGAVLTLGTSALHACLHGLQEMGVSSVATVAAKTLNLVGAVGILVAGGKVLALGTATIVAAAFALGITYVGYRRVLPRSESASSHLAGRSLLAASVPFLVADASLVVYQQIDTVVMSLLLEKDAIGWYAAADVLFGSSLFVPVIVVTAMFPAIAELHSRAPEQVPPMLTRSFNRLLIVAMPIGLGTVVVSRSFVETLYGAEYAPSAQVLAVFGVVTVLTCQTVLLGGFALATGRVRIWTALMCAAIVVSVPIDIVLVPWTDRRFDNGALGGALAYVVTEVFLIVAGVVIIAPGLVSRATVVRTVRCLAAGGVMLAVGLPLRDQSFLLSGAASVLAYAVAIVVFRTLDDDDYEMVDSALGKLGLTLPARFR